MDFRDSPSLLDSRPAYQLKVQTLMLHLDSLGPANVTNAHLPCFPYVKTASEDWLGWWCLAPES